MKVKLCSDRSLFLKQGQPSFVRIFQYPNFGGLPASLASKSFYKAETADLLWNKKGCIQVFYQLI